MCGLVGGGCLQDYEYGTVYSTPSTGTRAVRGLIRAKSWAVRGQNSSYGYPISDQVCGLKDGGCLQDFEHGSIRDERFPRAASRSPTTEHNAAIGMMTSVTATTRTLVIIPAWNEEAAFPETIREIKVSAPDCDVLVVDDGSTDWSERAKEYVTVLERH